MTPKIRRDRGFTLIEMLITVTILGVIAAAIGGAMVVILRTQSIAPDRLADSNNAQQLTNYFTADISSADTIDASPAPADWGCAGVAPGAYNVVKLQWTEDASGRTTVATYRLIDRDGSWDLVRYSCQPGSSAGNISMARNLLPPPAGYSSTAAAPLNEPVALLQNGGRYGLQITDSDRAYTFTVQATRQNPNVTFPDANPAGCQATVVFDPAQDPAPPIQLNTTGVVQQGVTIVVNAPAPCPAPVRILFTTGPVEVPLTNVVGTDDYTGVLPAGTATSWPDASNQAWSVRSGTNAVLETGVVPVVRLACSLSVSWWPVEPISLSAAGEFLQTVTVTASAPSPCPVPTTMRFPAAVPANAGPGPADVILTGSAGTYTGTIAAGAATLWNSGNQPWEVRSASGVIGTGLVSVTRASACSVTDVTATPGSRSRQSNGTLNNNINITVTSTGCTGTLQIGFVPGVNQGTEALPPGLAPLGPRQQVNLSASADEIGKDTYNTWTTGNKTVWVFDATGSLLYGEANVFRIT